jgi:hypothetical protein
MPPEAGKQLRKSDCQAVRSHRDENNRLVMLKALKQEPASQIEVENRSLAHRYIHAGRLQRGRDLKSLLSKTAFGESRFGQARNGRKLYGAVE